MGACAKHVFLVTDPAALEATLRTAFEIARSGRPGPVVVDIPKDVQNGRATFSPATRSCPSTAIVAACRRSRTPISQTPSAPLSSAALCAAARR